MPGMTQTLVRHMFLPDAKFPRKKIDDKKKHVPKPSILVFAPTTYEMT